MLNRRSDPEEKLARKLLHNPMRKILMDKVLMGLINAATAERDVNADKPEASGKLDLRNITALQEEMRSHGLIFEYLGDPAKPSNNKIFRITQMNTKFEKDPAVILQYSEQGIYQETMRKRLADAKFGAVVREYGELQKVQSAGRDSDTAQSTTYHLVVMKNCASDLNQVKKDLQRCDAAEKLARIEDATSKISAVLDEINRLGFVFTDLKEGNILFDENGDIQIADTKAFKDAGMPETPNMVWKMAVDTSPGYISPEFQSAGIKFPKDTPREAIVQRWEKEYSFQLAVIIYRLATGDSSPQKRVQKNGAMIDMFELNFDHEFFKSVEGKQLAQLIKDLCEGIPHKGGVAELRKIAADAVSKAKRARELRSDREKIEELKGKTPEERATAFMEAATQKEESIALNAMSADERLRNLTLKKEAAYLQKETAHLKKAPRVYSAPSLVKRKSLPTNEQQAAPTTVSAVSPRSRRTSLSEVDSDFLLYDNDEQPDPPPVTEKPAKPQHAKKSLSHIEGTQPKPRRSHSILMAAFAKPTFVDETSPKVGSPKLPDKKAEKSERHDHGKSKNDALVSKHDDVYRKKYGSLKEGSKQAREIAEVINKKKKTQSEGDVNPERLDENDQDNNNDAETAAIKMDTNRGNRGRGKP